MLAVVVRLLDETLIRVGNNEYAATAPLAGHWSKARMSSRLTRAERTVVNVLDEVG